ncbi:MAG: cobalamin B12-binding domain-containing protein [Planctomycetes bacterium]|nr:cobalamin B12-binding domain-containing protein [Planctomycetota bacterium]
MSEQVKSRVLIAKPGLDGHDRGAKVVAHLLIEAGMEVIYTGLHQTADQIVKAALEEDVNVIALSILSGAHIPICEQLLKKMKQAKIGNKTVVVGGVIPEADARILKKMGVKAVFPTGTRFEDITGFITKTARTTAEVTSIKTKPR